MVFFLEIISRKRKTPDSALKSTTPKKMKLTMEELHDVISENRDAFKTLFFDMFQIDQKIC